MRIQEIVVRYQVPNSNGGPDDTYELYLDPGEASAVFFTRADACCFAEACKHADPCVDDDRGCPPGSKRRITPLMLRSYGEEAMGDSICVWDPRTGRIRCTM